jgi:hypothetical protein
MIYLFYLWIYISINKTVKIMIFTKIDEFLLENTAPEPVTKPAPTKTPGTTPDRSPNRPSPIRRDKPSVSPVPKAKIGDIFKKFMAELRKNKTPMEFDLGKLKTKYND